MKNKGLFIIILTISLGCSSNTSQISNGIDSIAINANISMPTLQTQIDTINSIKGHCFLLENLDDQKENQYRRIISFETLGFKCKYSVLNTNSNTMVGRELDGRPIGKWKLLKDTLYINWDGFYIGYDDWSDKNKLNRQIEGKYKIEKIDTTIQLKFISETVLTADIDSAAPDIGYKLYYSYGINGMYYKPIDCSNAESKYLVKDFIPEKKKDSYSDEYNKNHNCNNQKSFDAGYDLARNQLGQGLLADCDYLYKIAVTQEDNLNHYCFCKGVSQWLKDNNRSY